MALAEEMNLNDNHAYEGGQIQILESGTSSASSKLCYARKVCFNSITKYSRKIQQNSYSGGARDCDDAMKIKDNDINCMSLLLWRYD